MAAYSSGRAAASLDGLGERAPLPITEERFFAALPKPLAKKAQRGLRWLTLAPPRRLESTGLALVDAWNAGERKLRHALGKVRAERMKKPFDAQDGDFPPRCSRRRARRRIWKTRWRQSIFVQLPAGFSG